MSQMNILIISSFCTERFALHIAEAPSLMGQSVRQFEPSFPSGCLGSKFWHCIDQFRGVSRSLLQISEVGQ